jgi:hypothetical protein
MPWEFQKRIRMKTNLKLIFKFLNKSLDVIIILL